MTIRKAHLVLALLVAFLVPASAQALQDRTFMPASGDWNDPANWSPGGVPGSGDRAIVGAGQTATVGAPGASPEEVQLNGTISVAAGATLAVGSALTVGNGTLTGPGAVELGPGSTMSINGLTLLGGVDLTLAATTSWTGGTIAVRAGAGTTSLVVPPGGTFALLDGGSITSNTIDAASARVVSNGTITKSGAGTTNLNPRFRNAGSVDVAAGLLNVGNGPPDGESHTGGFSAAAGASLSLNGGAHHLAAGASFAGLGELTYTGGTIAAGATIPVEGMRLAGTLTFGAGSRLSVGRALDLVGGTVLTGPGDLDFAPGSTFVLAMGGFQLQLQRGFELALPVGTGTTWTSGNILLQGNFGPTTLRVPPAATFPLLDGGVIFASAAGDRFVNEGTVVKTGAGDAFVSAPFITSGLLDVQAGTLTGDVGGGAAHITQDGGQIAVAAGAFLRANLTMNGGTLTGRGDVLNLSNNAGTVAPGGPDERGALTVRGDYTQGAAGTLEVDINGTTLGSGGPNGYDRLAVGAPDTNGIANLAGPLAIVNDPSFVPQPTDVFTILTRKSGAGTFTLTGAQTPAGTYEATYAPTKVDLGFVSNPSPSADLSIAKSDSPDPVAVGGALTYTLTVSNAGPDAASDVQVRDALPAGLTLDSATPSQGTCSQAAGTVTCDLGSIARDRQATVAIELTPNAAGTISNTATVSSSTDDPVGDNNSDSEDTLVESSSTATITVVKELIPADDPGRFDLEVGGNTSVGVGDGGRLGPVTVLPASNPVTVGESANGGPALSNYARSIACVEDPAGGTTAPPVSNPADGTVQLTVAPGDDWTCTITNRRVVSNRPPVAADDAVVVSEGSRGNAIDVLANDSDPDGDALTITGSTAAARGTASCKASSCAYTPNAGYIGADRFTYTIDDGHGHADTATVAITVERRTAIRTPAPAGGTVLDVVDTTGFVGRVIRIGVGGTAETNSVTGIGSLLLATPLRFDHGAGEPVVAVDDTLFVSVRRGSVVFKQKRAGDRAEFSGTFTPVTGAAAGCGEDVGFSLDGVFSQLVPGTLFNKNRGCSYTRTRKAPRGIESIRLDFAAGTWTVQLSGIDLDALTNPVEVALSIGDNRGSESVVMREQRSAWSYSR